MAPSVWSAATLWMTTGGAICKCRLPAIAVHARNHLSPPVTGHRVSIMPAPEFPDVKSDGCALALSNTSWTPVIRRTGCFSELATGCLEPVRHRKLTPKMRSGPAGVGCGATLNSLRQRGRPPAGHWFPNRWRPATDLAFRGQMLGQASPLRMRRFLERPAASGMC